MKKKSLLIILLGVALIIVGLILLFGGSSSNSETPGNITPVNETGEVENEVKPVIAKIIVYSEDGNEEINSVEITDEADGNKLSEFINQLKPLSQDELVDLLLIRNVEIRYGSSTIVDIQTGNEDYCLFSTNNNAISNMSHMPTGLMEWLREKVL